MPSPFLTPLLQALSEENYDTDTHFGGKDQVDITSWLHSIRRNANRVHLAAWSV